MAGGEDNDELPSIDLVRREIDILLAEQQHRGQSFDTKAGMFLGISGVILGLVASYSSCWFLAVQTAAVLAAGSAIVALMPRMSASLDPLAIRNNYLTLDTEIAKLRLLDSRILTHTRDETRMRRKIFWLRVSILFIVVTVALLITASIIEAGIGGQT